MSEININIDLDDRVMEILKRDCRYEKLVNDGGRLIRVILSDNKRREEIELKK